VNSAQISSKSEITRRQ